MNNLDLMRKRLEYQGGVRQEDRMIKDKYNTFLRALQYSYQGCDVSNEEDENTIYRALINPNKVKEDYDDKIISIGYDSGFKSGTVFKWIGTNSYWIIYLEELTEDAYFRGDIRLCRYEIKFLNENKKICTTKAAIRGPVETQITSIQKNGIRLDQPNLTLNILVPNNKDNLYIFQRYNIFLLGGKAWQVNTVDTISLKNVIEVNAEEYYINKDSDDQENQIADGLEVIPIDPNEPDNKIIGDTWILPMVENIYTVNSDTIGNWSIEGEFPINLCEQDNTVKVTWEKSVSGEFTLKWTDEINSYSKIIIVQSLL